jgi:hypothetical protein
MLRNVTSVVYLAVCFNIAGCGGGDSNTSQTTGIPSGYADLCGVNGVTCATDGSPANLVGTYTGTGTTTVSSNEIWSVGSSESFKAVIAAQTGETGSGYFEMAGYHFDVSQATIRGSASQFTIFGTDSVESTDPDAGVETNCSVEARAVVTGTQTTASDETTVAGYVNLQFTKNIHGSGCTQDQIDNYPGTGAVFKYTATRSP